MCNCFVCERSKSQSISGHSRTIQRPSCSWIQVRVGKEISKLRESSRSLKATRVLQPAASAFITKESQGRPSRARASPKGSPATAVFVLFFLEPAQEKPPPEKNFKRRPPQTHTHWPGFQQLRVKGHKQMTQPLTLRGQERDSDVAT